jgi:hypothetical protein
MQTLYYLCSETAHALKPAQSYSNRRYQQYQSLIEAIGVTANMTPYR